VAPFRKVIDNVLSGMKERVFYTDSRGTKPPSCVRDAGDFDSLIDTLVKTVLARDRDTGEMFILSRVGSGKRRYSQAREDLRTRPRSLDDLSRLGFFTKWEATVWNKEQVPRIVSPRDYGYNYLLGKYLRPVEKPIFDALPVLFKGSKVIAKGCTQQEKGNLIAAKLEGRVAVGLDASRFDQTIGKVLLTAEHRVYNGIFKSRQLRQLLACQLRNRGVAFCKDGMIKADIGPMRCSGDQNTSLGNCIISCLLAKLFFLEHGIDGDVLNDGDDLIMFVPENALPHMENLGDWYLKWGLRMKVEEPAHIPEQVEFCQSRPVKTPDGWVLVRNPGKALNTDYSGAEKVASLDKYLCHLRTVGICGLSMAAGIPIFQSFYEYGIRNGKTGRADDLAHNFREQARIQMASGYYAKSRDVDPITRASFETAFGIAAHDQLLMEQWFSMATFGCPVGSNTTAIKITQSLSPQYFS